MSVNVTIVDYGMGNLWSVYSALHYLGQGAVLSSEPKEVANADMLILPGVGSFRNGMRALRQKYLDEAIVEAVQHKQRKVLGICLGMQLLADQGTEDGESNGLGLISARVERFGASTLEGLKLPHIGFNRVNSSSNSKLFQFIPFSSDFYFVHSYRLKPENLTGVHAVSVYGTEFLAAYEKDNIYATQFHPEKSQTNGLTLIRNFLRA